MKIFGVAAGRHNGNSEAMVRAALEVCEKEFGAEVSWMNLHDHDFHPCTGCELCTISAHKQKIIRCSFDEKDDYRKIMLEEYLPADGVIIAAPSYMCNIPGVLRTFFDRMNAYNLPNFLNLGMIDKIPQRVAGLICCGGSTSTRQTMTLETMHYATSLQNMKVVDKLMAIHTSRPGQALLHDDLMEQVRQLGRNVAYSLTIPWDEVKFLGDTSLEMCPVCHSNLIRKGAPQYDGTSFNYECAVCGCGGELVADETGRIKLKLDPNGESHCRLTVVGRRSNLTEVRAMHAEAEENKDEIARRLKESKAYMPRRV